jgi:hypothetical protein
VVRRTLAPRLKALAGRFPVLAVVGPRQSGKTTLAGRFGGRYFDLEQEADRHVLVSRTPHTAGSGKGISTNLPGLLKLLEE